MLPVRKSRSPLLCRFRRVLPIAAFALAAGVPIARSQAAVAAANLPDAPQQGTSSSAPQSTQQPDQSSQKLPNATKPSAQTSEEVLRQEERQRILGVVPNFNMVESAANVPPLTPKQKFHLMYKSSIDPFVFVADGFVAGIGQAQDSNPGFGQGAAGYFKRFGAAYADTADGALWGNAILPVLFKEDPRYFRLGTGRFTRRFLYAASTTVWSRRDNGTWGPAYANVLGNFISGGISNAYYPAEDRGLEQTVTGALTVTAEGTIGAEFIEFWPDISRRLFKKRHTQP
jgi:hypothetical protein